MPQILLTLASVIAFSLIIKLTNTEDALPHSTIPRFKCGIPRLWKTKLYMAVEESLTHTAIIPFT